jgi:hypothetical protein
MSISMTGFRCGIRAALAAAALLPVVALAEPQPINTTMTEIGGIMSNLLSEKVLSEPDVTLKQLDQLDARFRSMEPHTVDRGPAFRITWHTMLEQIARTRDAVDGGVATRDSLQNLVHGIASACAGCHTQDDRSQALSFGKLAPNTTDPLQNARFRYIVRDYAGALKLYETFIDAQPRLAYSGPVLDALEGELTILAQVFRDSERGAAHFRNRIERSGGSMSKQVRKDMQSWIRGFDEIRKARIKAFEPTLAELEGWAKQFILRHEGVPIVTAEHEKVVYLWLRGLLHEYVQAHPQDERMPELLYWLAITDRVLDYNFYYSLADLYLKECIVHYPAADAAEDCYAEYERYVEFAYSGSSGPHVPAEIRDELILLREVLDAARKKIEVPATEIAPGALAPDDGLVLP